MTEYLWASPGGAYVVPADFKREFLADFPAYRIRWSLSESCWHIEQAYGRGALPSISADPFHDDRIRERDGYWLVMKTQPGNTMPCRQIVDTNPLKRCGWRLTVPEYRTGEVRCPICHQARRDGRTVGGFWPFGSRLLEHLRSTNPLSHGVVRIAGKNRTAASVQADRNNAARDREIDRTSKDAITSIDSVDYRWISGIPSSTGLSRRTIDEKDLE